MGTHGEMGFGCGLWCGFKGDKKMVRVGFELEVGFFNMVWLLKIGNIVPGMRSNVDISISISSKLIPSPGIQNWYVTTPLTTQYCLLFGSA